MKRLAAILAPIIVGAALLAPRIERMSDQGEVRFMEDTANGVDYAALRAPPDLVAPYTLSLPTALPGSTQFLQVSATGDLSYGNAAAATLDTAYDNGRTITADAGAIALSTSTGNSLLTVTQTGAVAPDAVQISNSLGSGDALEVTAGTARFIGPLVAAGAASLDSTATFAGSATFNGSADFNGGVALDSALVGALNSSATLAALTQSGAGKAFHVTAGVSQLDGHAYFKSGRPWVSLRAFGPTGDGVANDTSAVQSAMDAAHTATAIVYVDPGTYSIDTVNVGDNVKGIIGAGWASVFAQRTVDVGGLTWDGTNGCHVEWIEFDGIVSADDDSGDANCGIRIKSTAGTPAIGDNKNFSVERCHFKEWKYCAIFAQYVSGLELQSNLVESCSHGFELWDQRRARVVGNEVRDSTLTTKLAIGIIFATTNSTTPTEHNQDLFLGWNTISGFHTGESILVHDGINVGIDNNIISEALIGIAVQPSGSGTQEISSVTITGNTIRHRTSVNSATETGNSSIFVGGNAVGNRASSVTVVGNQSWRANHVKNTSGEGAYKISHVRNIVLSANQAYNPHGAGFTCGNNGDNVQLIGNGVFDVDTDGTNQAGIIFRPSVAYTGLMAWNSIEDSSAGIQVLGSGNCSALHTYENRFITVSSEYSLSGGATLGQRVFDTSSTVDIPSILDGDQATGTVTMGGVAIGDYIDVSLSISLAGIGLSAYGSATDTITWLAQNNSGGALDPASATMKFRIRKQ